MLQSTVQYVMYFIIISNGSYRRRTVGRSVSTLRRQGMPNGLTADRVYGAWSIR